MAWYLKLTDQFWMCVGWGVGVIVVGMYNTSGNFHLLFQSCIGPWKARPLTSAYYMIQKTIVI